MAGRGGVGFGGWLCIYLSPMEQTRNKVAMYTRIDPELREAMQRYKAALGVPEAVQIDRALREWLAERPEAWPLPAAKAKRRRSK